MHFNGASGHFYYPEILPPGVGLLDYDNDGDLDVFLVQGRMLGPGSSVADALIPPASPGPLMGRLYRNDLDAGPDGIRSWRFVDVTEQSGLAADGYGFGVAAGDMDNDGWIDLLVTSFDAERLFRNEGDGTFTDVSDRTGIDARMRSASRRRSSTTTGTAGWICTSATTSTTTSTTAPSAPTRRERVTTVLPKRTGGCPTASIETWGRDVRRRQPDRAPAHQYRRGLARDAGTIRTGARRGHRRL